MHLIPAIALNAKMGHFYLLENRVTSIFSY